MPNTAHRLPLLLIMFLLTLHTQGQEGLGWYSYQLSTDNLLYSNYVRGIVQTKNGYIWMGTADGLSRFDGYRQTTFHPTEQGNTSLLLGNSIQSVSTVGDRWVIVGLRRQLYSVLDARRSVFVDYTGDGSNVEPYRRFVTVAGGDNNGCGTQIFFYDAKVGGKMAWTDADGLWHSEKWSLPKVSITRCVSFDGQLLAVTKEGGVMRWNKNVTKMLARCPAAMGGQGDVSEAVVHNGEIWMVKGSAILIYYIKEKKWRTAPLPLHQPHVEKDNAGTLIVLSNDGETIYLHTQGAWHTLKGVYSTALLKLNSDARFRFFQTRAGEFLVSTKGNGLWLYNPHTKQTTHFSANDNPRRIDTDYLLAVMADKDDNLWVCQENLGIRVLQQQSRAVTWLNVPQATGSANGQADVRMVRRTSAPTTQAQGEIAISYHHGDMLLADGNMSSFNKQQRGDDDVVMAERMSADVMALGFRRGGLAIGRNTYVNSTNVPTSVSRGKVNGMVKDGDALWVVTFEGFLDLLSPDGKGGYSVRHILDGDVLSQPRSMIIDSQRRLWVAHNGGVVAVDADKILRNRKAYSTIPFNEQSRIPFMIYCVYEDSKHRIWVGSAGYGLMAFTPHSDKATGTTVATDKQVFTIEEGLPDNNVVAITEDHDGRIWAGTSNGVACIHNGGVTPYRLSPEHLGNICAENSAVTLDNGNIAFGTRLGIVTFDPGEMKPQKASFPLAITELDVNGSPPTLSRMAA